MAKKYKLFKVAKELNIASDTIIAFLEKKGLQVKGPNTSLTDEDYSEILEKFSIEKERADILHAKREHDKVLSEEAVASEVALTETGIEKDPVEVAAVSDKKVAKESVVAVKEEPPSKTFLEEKLEMSEKDKIERVGKRRSKLEKAKADPADKEEVTDETGKKKVAAPKKAETAADKISEKKKEKQLKLISRSYGRNILFKRFKILFDWLFKPLMFFPSLNSLKWSGTTPEP